MRPDQLPLLTTVSAPALHPDGRWAVVATSRPDFDADAYVGQLFRVELDGSGVRRLTRGRSDSRPRFSPDGALIGFLRAGANDRPQVHLLPVDGGEALCVTNAPLGVSDFAFSPDSASLAFVARVPAPGRYGTLKDVAADHEDPRHFTTLSIQANGLGWTPDRRSQLFVLDVPDVFAEPVVTPVGRAAEDADPEALKDIGFPVPQQLTDADVDHGQPRFTADGSAVLVTAGRLTEPETLVGDLLRVAVDGSGSSVLNDGSLDAGWAVDTGGTVWFAGADLGESGLEFVAAQSGVYRLTEAGIEQRTDEDVLVAAELAPAQGGVLAITESRGASQLLKVTAEGTEILLDRDRNLVLTGVSATGAAPGGEVVVASYADGMSPGEVGLVEKGRITPLTDFSAPLRAGTTIREPKELTAAAPDGYPVHGWVLTPDGDGPHPVLLMIHGGPFAAYTSAFFDEAQVYAQAGYAVVMCNPRGSAGYGRAHGLAIKGAFGDRDTADVLAFLDHAVATVPGLDGDRVGVMGGSYGGYLTAWIIAHDHRWAGAIVERGFLDPASFVGASDIGWFFPQQYNGDRERMNAQSPTLLTDAVTTPTFVIHSEQDLRCPLSQALRYYTELKLAGVVAELLVFPGENHELSRSGTPWHRRQRFEAILDWWSRHLPV
ncbi:S9 family peptidase [Micropruina sonneratiae]|uniref:S9 family peptidase n=1 Tax=Micropruina sonneratiae TaxID=2986940 RepID=UPI0022273ADE|nr:S9 family peptidase [Micropruina sp. KQZ13P-5]MCW3156980.1 S9 family peptidase [Micropruina sp. KQZ13P-5]